MASRTGYLPLAIIAMVIIAVSCNTQNERGTGRRVVTDSWGRSMPVTDSVRSVTCIGSGALRLICYMDLADRVR